MSVCDVDVLSAQGLRCIGGLWQMLEAACLRLQVQVSSCQYSQCALCTAAKSSHACSLDCHCLQMQLTRQQQTASRSWAWARRQRPSSRPCSQPTGRPWHWSRSSSLPALTPASSCCEPNRWGHNLHAVPLGFLCLAPCCYSFLAATTLWRGNSQQHQDLCTCQYCRGAQHPMMHAWAGYVGLLANPREALSAQDCACHLHIAPAHGSAGLNRLMQVYL